MGEPKEPIKSLHDKSNMYRLGEFIVWLRYKTTFIEKIAIFGIVSILSWYIIEEINSHLNFGELMFGLSIEFILLFIIFGGKK